MASKEHKIVRRAEAMGQLDFLSKLLAEQFNLEPVSVDVTNRDSELAEIQRIENINGLLTQVLQAGKVEGETKIQSTGDMIITPEPESAKKSAKKNAPVK